VLGILKAMPGILRDENSRSLFKGMPHVIENHDAAAFQNGESFVHLEMSVDRNSRTSHHLLRPHSKRRRSRSRAELNQDIAMVAKVNEMLAFVGTEHGSVLGRRLHSSRKVWQHLAHPETSQRKQERPTFLIISVHQMFLTSIEVAGNLFA
jgi:hypothetical protein